MFWINSCIFTVQTKTWVNYFARCKEQPLYWQKDWSPPKEVLPESSCQAHPPYLPHPPLSLFPSSTSTPCYSTNLTRWSPNLSNSDSQSSQKSSSKEDEIQVSLARLFQPYNTKWKSGGHKGKSVKGKDEYPGAIIFIVSQNQRALFCHVLKTQRFLSNVVWAIDTF